jgi:RNA polymerase sigma factor (sigma-70 family)
MSTDGDADASSTGRPVEMRSAADQWAAIYQRHSTPIYRVLLGKVRNQADAEDLTAEVFIRAMGLLRMTASEREIRGYLLATARTILADHWRRTMSQPTLTLHEDIPEPARTPDAVDGGRLRAREILAQLPERYRQILELRFLSSRSLREAADELGITVGNAKVLQHRALSRAVCLGMRPATVPGTAS